MKTIKGNKLKLADVIRLDADKFADAIVCQITDTEVILRRPYMQAEDFSYTGGVITYIGLEEFKADKQRTFKLVYRVNPPVR